MANPLYRNEYYFFSSMYDDSLITDFYRKISAESYDRSVLYQQNMIGRVRNRQVPNIYYSVNLRDYLIDDDYNRKTNLPEGSITFKLDTFVVPQYNKKRYIRTYGAEYQYIPLIDFYNKTDIFSSSVVVQFGKLRTMRAVIIENPEHTVRLAFPNSNVDGILATHMLKIISEYPEDERLWVFTDEQTKVYMSNVLSSDIKITEGSNYAEITIDVSTAMNSIGESTQHEVFNSWDCMMTLNSAEYGQRALVSTICSLANRTSTNVTFSIPVEFINYLSTIGTSFNVVFVHRPNRKRIMIYKQNEATSPIINLDYDSNPSANITVEVYELDSTTMCKGRRLYEPEFTQIYFPNIFDFSQLNKNNVDMIVEVSEYYPTYTNQVMTNTLTPLIESLGNDFYTEYVVNGYDTNTSGESIGLKTFTPTHHPISLEDYMNSEYFGDIRAYMLDKIVKTIESDPYLLGQYYQWIENINRRVISLSGTPRKLRFNTGMSGEFSGKHEIVYDTSIASQNPDDIQYFTEPHSYFIYRQESNEAPYTVFIGGKYVRASAHRFYGGLNYIFYPIQKVIDAISHYPDEDALVAADPITVEFYPRSFVDFANVPKSTFTVTSTEDVIKLFSQLENAEMSLNNIVMYDNTTGEFINNWTDLFDVAMEVSEFVIQNPYIKDPILIANGEDLEYLLTALGELYLTLDGETIILEGNRHVMVLNNFIDDLIKDGIISDDDLDSLTNKVMDIGQLNFIPKSDDLIGRSFTVYPLNFKYEFKAMGDQFVESVDENGSPIWEYTFTNNHLDPYDNRWFIYIDGLYSSDAYLVRKKNIYGAPLTIKLKNQPSANSEILLVHYPNAYKKKTWEYVTDDTNSFANLMYMKPADTTGTDGSTIWPMESPIFTEGMVFEVVDACLPSGNDIAMLYPIEDESHMMYTNNGFKLPPVSTPMNRIGAGYFDKDRSMNLVSKQLNGDIFILPTDIPITTTYRDDGYRNPLDKLFKKPNFVEANISIDGATIVTAPPYYVGSTIRVVADSAPDTMEFSHWVVTSGAVITNPYTPTTTLLITSANVEVSVVYKKIEVELDIEGANITTPPPYYVGSTVEIVADPAPENMEFSHWEIIAGSGVLENPELPDTKLTINSADIELAVVYRYIVATVNVTNGTITTEAPHRMNDSIEIVANEAPANMEFSHWVIDSGESTGVLTDANASTTTLLISAVTVTVSAVYRGVDAIVNVTNGTITTPAPYRVNDSVQIVANAAPANMQFSHWEITAGNGTLTDQFASTTTLTINSTSVTVNAIYDYLAATISISGGIVTTAAPYRVNDSVQIVANEAPADMQFSHWEVVSGGAVTDPNASTTTLKITSTAVNVNAIYRPFNISATVDLSSGDVNALETDGGYTIDITVIGDNVTPDYMIKSKPTTVEPDPTPVPENFNVSATIDLSSGDVDAYETDGGYTIDITVIGDNVTPDLMVDPPNTIPVLENLKVSATVDLSSGDLTATETDGGYTVSVTVNGENVTPDFMSMH